MVLKSLRLKHLGITGASLLLISTLACQSPADAQSVSTPTSSANEEAIFAARGTVAEVTRIGEYLSDDVTLGYYRFEVRIVINEHLLGIPRTEDVRLTHNAHAPPQIGTAVLLWRNLNHDDGRIQFSIERKFSCIEEGENVYPSITSQDFVIRDIEDGDYVCLIY